MQEYILSDKERALIESRRAAYQSAMLFVLELNGLKGNWSMSEDGLKLISDSAVLARTKPLEIVTDDQDS